MDSHLWNNLFHTVMDRKPDQHQDCKHDCDLHRLEILERVKECCRVVYIGYLSSSNPNGPSPHDTYAKSSYYLTILKDAIDFHARMNETEIY
jgi:hypothetical protein